jgi:small subunit ribosomal protein S5
MNLDEFTDDLIKWADKFPVGEVTGTLKKLEDFAPEELKDKPEGQWPAEARKDIHEQYVAYLQNQAENNKDGKSDDGGNMLVGPTDADVLEYILQRSSMTDKGLISNSDMAPALPRKVPGVEGMYKNPVDPEDEGMDEEGVYQDLKLRTGMTVQELLGLNVKILARRFVSNQTRLGKVQSLSVTAICGNGNGWLGIGQGKAVEPSHAQTQAVLKAMENMKPILRYEDRTTFGNLKCKISGTVVELYSRPPGTVPPIFLSRNPANTSPRIRPPRASPYLRNRPRSRHPGPGGQDPALPQSHEHSQGCRSGIANPASPRGDRHGARQEAGRCPQGVLWRASVLDHHLHSITCIIPCRQAVY